MPSIARLMPIVLNPRGYDDSMNNETLRIADQLRQVFSGNPWYGFPLTELLAGITAEEAAVRPLPSLHSIWELVLHMNLWARVALEASQGVSMPKLYGTEKDWLTVDAASAPAWQAAKEQIAETINHLAQAIARFDDTRLPETVPGREYDFEYLFRGIIQHSVYHFGQIAMVKAAIRT